MLTPPIRPQKPLVEEANYKKKPPAASEEPAELIDRNLALLHSPCFQATTIKALPPLLSEGCHAFQSERERDVFVIATLAVLSGCIPSVRGLYDGVEVQANLFAFVVAPAGSGKGALTWARIMGVALHKAKTEASERAKREYEQRLADSRSDKQSFSERAPPYQSLFLAGNSSASAFIKALQENNESGIICETEADTLSGALKQDWGDYSDLLRKGFHHESMSYLRKSGERYEIERPAISVVLAGTPGQVIGLIPNSENGLFSRFLFYCFENTPAWRDVSPQPNRPSLNQHFGRLSEAVKDMAHCLEDVGNITFSLKPNQWQYFNESCVTWLANAIEDTARDFSSSVYRMGLIVYRLAMILSVLQGYSKRLLPKILVCDDMDFATAMDMAKVLLAHSKLMYANLPSAGGKMPQGDKSGCLLQKLPVLFERSMANEVAGQIGLSKRSVTNYLQRLVDGGHIQKLEHGKYQKS